MLFGTVLVSLAALVSTASAHYTFPSISVGGSKSADWMYVRRTTNAQSRNPITNVASQEFRCFTTGNAKASTATVAAGSTLGYNCDGTIYHIGVLNIYMAKAPGNVSDWDGSGNVWFKVHEISAKTDGGRTISWPSENLSSVSFTVPKSLPSGEYLVRIEHIALHQAMNKGGAQFYISCAQINVTGGGSGTPGPLVAIPGVYTGSEPGILVNINYPIPSTYTQPGPALWRG